MTVMKAKSCPTMLDGTLFKEKTNIVLDRKDRLRIKR